MTDTSTLSLASLPLRSAAASAYCRLEMNLATGPELSDTYDIIGKTLGQTIPQGSLFAYLFRRFGYPNRGWDDHKELACYVLSTSREDMFLRIVPFAGGDSQISISVLTPIEVALHARDWIEADQIAHRDGFAPWIIETCGKPDWLDHWIPEAQRKGYLPPSPGGEVSALDAMRAFERFMLMSKDQDDPRIAEMRKARMAYEVMYPEPDRVYRAADWRTWPDADPLKAYVAAAVTALEDLRRPVFVRDIAIDPWGAVADDDLHGHLPAIDTPAPAAGYPSGDLGNVDAVLFAQIHSAILKLADDPQDAMRIALARLSPPT